MRCELVTKSTSGEYGQFETSPDAIEPELRTALCERRQTDRLKTNYSIDVGTISNEGGLLRRFLDIMLDRFLPLFGTVDTGTVWNITTCHKMINSLYLPTVTYINNHICIKENGYIERAD